MSKGEKDVKGVIEKCIYNKVTQMQKKSKFSLFKRVTNLLGEKKVLRILLTHYLNIIHYSFTL